jgi:hypothetical protein
MAAKHPDRKIPRPASRPLETLTKIAAQNLDGFLFMAYLLSRTVVHKIYLETTDGGRPVYQSLGFRDMPDMMIYGKGN